MIFPIIDYVFPWETLGTTHPLPLLRQPRRGQRLRQLRHRRAVEALQLGATQGHQGTLERHLAMEVTSPLVVTNQLKMVIFP